MTGRTTHEIAVVIPVYRGAESLPAVVAELSALADGMASPGGIAYVVSDVILVHDCGPDDSDQVIVDLEAQYPVVRSVWLARNFGQHAATLAGIASSSATWVVTMDEDGQHVPSDIGILLDRAADTGAELVYGVHAHGAPHAVWRNVASRSAKRVSRLLTGVAASDFSSFRLILGEYARAMAAYVGPRVYLDLALKWVVKTSATAVITTRSELRAGSGYNLRRLLSHFWTLLLTSGTRPLRIISAVGVGSAFIGFAGAIVALILKIRNPDLPQGWPSMIATLLVIGGLILLTLGVVAEYIGATLMASLGRPLYVIVDGPQAKPFADHAGAET